MSERRTRVSVRQRGVRIPKFGLLRVMVQAFAEALMSAEADGLCGAPYRRPASSG